MIKKIVLGTGAFLASPVLVFLDWTIASAIIDAVPILQKPVFEVGYAVISGLLIPILLQAILFWMTQNSQPGLAGTVRICGIIGCVLTIILVLFAIPWIMFGAAYRGVRM